MKFYGFNTMTYAPELNSTYILNKNILYSLKRYPFNKCSGNASKKDNIKYIRNLLNNTISYKKVLTINFEYDNEEVSNHMKDTFKKENYKTYKIDLLDNSMIEVKKQLDIFLNDNKDKTLNLFNVNNSNVYKDYTTSLIVKNMKIETIKY